MGVSFSFNCSESRLRLIRIHALHEYFRATIFQEKADLSCLFRLHKNRPGSGQARDFFQEDLASGELWKGVI